MSTAAEVLADVLDDGQVTLPAVTIYRRGADLIDEYRVFVDLAPAYA